MGKEMRTNLVGSSVQVGEGQEEQVVLYRVETRRHCQLEGIKGLVDDLVSDDCHQIWQSPAT